MTEHSAHSENSYPHTSTVIVEETQASAVQPVDDTGKTRHISKPIIWTPRFIVLFFFTVVIGLSVESLLTQGWLNRAYRAEWVLLAHALLLLACLIVVVVRSRSMWLRVGSSFGCVWAVFTGASYIVALLGVNERSAIALQFQAVMACALLGMSICFSTHRIPFRRWDSLFFWLAPPLGGCAVAILYALSRTDPHHSRVLVHATTTVLLSLCVAIWWIRPSCWRSQPCITFLFGVAPLLLLLLPVLNADTIGTQFFFSQVLLLCILLGVMRVLQGEIHNHA